MNIRNATSTYLDSANRIIEAAIMTWDLPDRVKRLSIPTYKYKGDDLQHMTIVVAEVDQTIVGVAAWYTAEKSDTPEDKSALLLHGIYVDPKHHRRGIGRALFQAAEAAALEQGVDGLLVKSQKGSDDFYVNQDMSKLPVTDQRRDFENRYWKPIDNPN